MQCTYCKTENAASEIRCAFCEADLTSRRPAPKNLVILKNEEKYLDLIQYHTYDLLILLREARKARSDAFTFLSSLLKLSNKIKVPKDTKTFTEDDYKLYTAYANLIQEIIRDRIGYIPKRVDDKLLEAWSARISSQRNV